MIIRLVELLIRNAAKEINFPYWEYDDGLEEMVYQRLGEEFHITVSHNMEITHQLLTILATIVREWQESEASN